MSSIRQARRRPDPVSLIVRICAALALITIGLFFTPLFRWRLFSLPSFNRYFDFIFWSLVLLPIGGALIQLVRFRTLGAKAVVFDFFSAFLPPLGYLGFLMYMGH
jgi:hypothetical protein